MVSVNDDLHSCLSYSRRGFSITLNARCPIWGERPPRCNTCKICDRRRTARKIWERLAATTVRALLRGQEGRAGCGYSSYRLLAGNRGRWFSEQGFRAVCGGLWVADLLSRTRLGLAKPGHGYGQGIGQSSGTGKF